MIRFCLAVYRRLARAFPHEFQMVYGADVVQLGEDAIEESGEDAWRDRPGAAAGGSGVARAGGVLQ